MIRSAVESDIPRLAEIRAAVGENRLTDPTRVTAADYQWYVAHGPIHVWVEDGNIAGFAAGNSRDGSIWALFVDPAWEGRGIGRALIAAACRTLADAGHRTARLSTDPGTRAERFYRRNGWVAQVQAGPGEVHFAKSL